jgi:flagellar export protein FliJ
MARFVFGLQTVLEQRETEETLCKKELYEAQLAQRKLLDELAETESQIITANETMRNEHLVGALRPTMIATHRRYLVAMKQQVFSLAERIAVARTQVEAKQRKLAEASKGKKVIELLRDKQKGRWVADQDRREQAAADDVAMQIAFHNLRAEIADVPLSSVGGSAA